MLTFWGIGDVEVHPAHLRTGLAGHAGAATANAGRLAANDKGQFQDDLPGPWDTDIDLQERKENVVRCCLEEPE